MEIVLGIEIDANQTGVYIQDLSNAILLLNDTSLILRNCSIEDCACEIVMILLLMSA